jgi:hypothetical protein
MLDQNTKLLLLKYLGAIFGPPIVPFVHVGVVEFIPVGLQLFPLNAGV